jgi:acyl carrier protein
LEVFEKIKSIIAEVVGHSEIKPETEVQDIGLDSLDMMEVAMAIEEQFDIIIEDDELVTATTIGAIVKLVESKAK